MGNILVIRDAFFSNNAVEKIDVAITKNNNYFVSPQKGKVATSWGTVDNDPARAYYETGEQGIKSVVIPDGYKIWASKRSTYGSGVPTGISSGWVNEQKINEEYDYLVVNVKKDDGSSFTDEDVVNLLYLIL